MIFKMIIVKKKDWSGKMNKKIYRVYNLLELIAKGEIKERN